jgi:hypothetical protein
LARSLGAHAHGCGSATSSPTLVFPVTSGQTPPEIGWQHGIGGLEPDGNGRSPWRSTARRSCGGSARCKRRTIWTASSACSPTTWCSRRRSGRSPGARAPSVRAPRGSLIERVPDLRWDEIRHFVCPDDAMVESVTTGTPPGGQRFEVHLVDVLPIRDGKIAVKRSYRKGRIQGWPRRGTHADHCAPAAPSGADSPPDGSASDRRAACTTACPISRQARLRYTVRSNSKYSGSDFLSANGSTWVR